MGLWRSLAGMLSVEITSASPAEMLTTVGKLGIAVHQAVSTGDLTIKCSIYRSDFKSLQKALESRGDKIKILRSVGLYWYILNLRHRPVLLIGCVFLIACMLYLPSRVLFVEVEGNSQITTQLILDKAEKCGIVFGASRRAVRSEQMKNALLEEIPQLQWAGINTVGCVAVISVRERETVDRQEQTSRVSSIVATQDGVIREVTVLRGNPLCKVGQAVKAGQVLVSGYTDCGISIKATRAEAEITAQTMRQFDAVTLMAMKKRSAVKQECVKYSLLVGKKLIKLFKDSGISDTSCVKMYEKQYLTLPGGFKLPIAIVTERCVSYDMETAAPQSDDFQWMERVSQDYLRTQMVAGQILYTDVTLSLQDTVCSLQGKYDCLEMIGRVQSEEIIHGYGENS